MPSFSIGFLMMFQLRHFAGHFDIAFEALLTPLLFDAAIFGCRQLKLIIDIYFSMFRAFTLLSAT